MRVCERLALCRTIEQMEQNSEYCKELGLENKSQFFVRRKKFMSRYSMCPNCGHRLSRYLDSFGNWDGETYICTHCFGDNDNDDYNDDDEDCLSVYDAALIWASNGKDEDYSFGYSDEDLDDAL